ncbi:MAG: hypothetical protein GY906_40640 [bacterium]|nr:hypothetical protein [bacterium]
MNGVGTCFSESDIERYRDVFRATMDYIKGSDYAGYNKHDGLNSPILHALFGGSKWTRIIAIQAVMRSPWNVRPLLGVPRTRNPKGLGLIANALLDVHAAEGRSEDLAEAQELVEDLLSRAATGFPGLSWGYQYPWQDLGFFAPRHYPNRVVTSWIGFAFVEAVWQTDSAEYLVALRKIAEFLSRAPNVLQDDAEMKCVSYVPDPSVTWAVMDVPALAGAFLAEAGNVLGCAEYLAEARRLLNWVADKQTPYGAWYYTHPASDSRITHDNYHTAIILDCFDRYRLASSDDAFGAVYKEGLHYYREHHFCADGAPRWMNDKEYPYDIHGAASGILCFVRAASTEPQYGEMAKLVLDWTLDNMYDPRGFFYYQKTRWMTKRFCLLRWCNGWMCRALSAVLRYGSENGSSVESP